MTCELTEKKITEILHTFYEKVRRDPLLSVPFSVVTDWDEHLVRLTEFWSSVMLTSGRYKGNPLSMHVIHADRIQPAMFNRWLELWQITTTEGLAPDVAQEMQAKATRIASRLSVAMFGHSTVRSSNTTPERSAPSPYKVTPSFDQASVPAALLRDHSLKAGS
ncbi:preprotein translocase subunit TatC [Pararhizobium arenae]|uniref:preprotein translocase subunit TatC n=1 Tax=Pararhizobium arenae TaxID=1856850 RepID=UPI0018E980AD|nr:preprotein translocase subunit TatC [Pararhizobium arenae]